MSVLFQHKKDIITSKEKLSEKELLLNLTKDQSEAAISFLNALRKLEPIAGLLNTQKKQFKERLERADSLELIDAIENEVQGKVDAMDGLPKKLLPYPTDEIVAGRLIKFLQDNNHLMNVLQSFDMEEVLLDDIQNARAAMSAENQFRP